jgi:glycolate oxidase FAD binding subunit
MDPAAPPLAELAERVRAATAARTPLCIRAGGSKDFYGNPPRGEILDPRGVHGIVDYEPSELVITVRAGTSLATLEAALAAEGQMLAFEPPHFGAAATVGGCVASGLAGPRRASAGVAHGALRDFVLGARLLDGRGALLAFGGTVMKNVAGYDVARLLAGSLGVLGVIVEVSLKVLPRPAAECTLRFEMPEAAALDALNGWGGRPLPISASRWQGGVLDLRLSGAAAAVGAAARTLGGVPMAAADADTLWQGVREQTAEFFAADDPTSAGAGATAARAQSSSAGPTLAGAVPTWRVSVPGTAPPLELPGVQLIEWGGALRWLRSAAPAEAIRARARALGGHATLFRGGERAAGVFERPSPAAMAIQRRLKAHFDPAGIFNPGRLYPEL